MLLKMVHMIITVYPDGPVGCEMCSKSKGRGDFHTLQHGQQTRDLFVPESVGVAVKVNTEDLKERERRSSVTSATERKCCIHLEHNNAKQQVHTTLNT